MKQETAIMCVKGICYMSLGAAGPLITGLTQWANTGEWPPRIIWVVMAASCLSGMATQLLAFLSGSYSDYLKSKTPPTPEPTKP